MEIDNNMVFKMVLNDMVVKFEELIGKIVEVKDYLS